MHYPGALRVIHTYLMRGSLSPYLNMGNWNVCCRQKGSSKNSKKPSMITLKRNNHAEEVLTLVSDIKRVVLSHHKILLYVGVEGPIVVIKLLLAGAVA
jgi:hypothetical protein